MKVSIIIPVFNESESIQELVDNIREILNVNYSDNYEIIIINNYNNMFKKTRF